MILYLRIKLKSKKTQSKNQNPKQPTHKALVRQSKLQIQNPKLITWNLNLKV